VRILAKSKNLAADCLSLVFVKFTLGYNIHSKYALFCTLPYRGTCAITPTTPTLLHDLVHRRLVSRANFLLVAVASFDRIYHAK